MAFDSARHLRQKRPTLDCKPLYVRCFFKSLYLATKVYHHYKVTETHHQLLTFNYWSMIKKIEFLSPDPLTGDC